MGGINFDWGGFEKNCRIGGGGGGEKKKKKCGGGGGGGGAAPFPHVPHYGKL